MPKRSTQPQAVARTVRFPRRLRERIHEDAERCGRSFEAQVIAVLRHHYGDDVDIAPVPEAVLALARASLHGVTRRDHKLLASRLTERTWR
jgi:hypothetical protein